MWSFMESTKPSVFVNGNTDGVARVKKEADPREPNTVPDAPPPNAAPTLAPWPCCINTKPIMPMASRTSTETNMLYSITFYSIVLIKF